MAMAKRTPARTLSEAKLSKAMKALETIKRARLGKASEREATAALRELGAYSRQRAHDDLGN